MSRILSATKRSLWILFFCGIIVILTTPTKVLLGLDKFEFRYSEMKSCVSYLDTNIQPNTFKLIIDEDFLSSLSRNYCSTFDKPIKIAIPSFEAETIISEQYPNFQIIYFENSSFTDYFKFYDDVTRMTPKFELTSIKLFHIPKNLTRFSNFWKRSKRIECHNLAINRTYAPPKLPLRYSVETLAKLRDLLIEFDMYAYLEGGTLLGWYRECTVIPHTLDMDLAVSIEEFNPSFEKFLKSSNRTFKLRRHLGMLNDSLEYTVCPLNSLKPPIDIFFMYNNGNHSWVAGTGGKGEKYRYILPLYDPYCAADLHGYLFWITCSPDNVLKVQYGNNWFVDHPTNKYSWNSSPKNVIKVGKYEKNELSEAMQIF